MEAADSVHAELTSLLWSEGDEESSELLLVHYPDAHKLAAPLLMRACECAAKIRECHAHASDLSGGFSSRLAVLAAKVKAANDAIAAAANAKPRPPGSILYNPPALSGEEEAEVDDALGGGSANEKLAEFENIPVHRSDMRTIRGSNWLNDEVINFFMKLLAAREGDKPDTLPKCYFTQTNFYTKLAEGPRGYCYKDVRRWTKKVDVFTKDLVIVPVHCHGNHWTLAVINFRDKRFEYYDSLRGAGGTYLSNLRRWLGEEHKDKKGGAEYDTSEWKDVTWKQGETPQQMNGSDCGVFMTRTADYLSRDAQLDFRQEDMQYWRRRMVLEIVTQQLMP